MTRLAIEDVSVDFGGIHALRDVTFALESGRIVGLIGPNGAGKSTLLNCISGITRPTKGTRPARRDGSLCDVGVAIVARQGIGRVFQHPELVVDLSVRDNLLIACHRALDYRPVSELLRCFRMRGGKSVRRPSRVAGVLGAARASPIAPIPTIRNLPYGHRKLIDLGRALLMDIASCCWMSRSPA